VNARRFVEGRAGVDSSPLCPQNDFVNRATSSSPWSRMVKYQEKCGLDRAMRIDHSLLSERKESRIGMIRSWASSTT
jgi:hypothetical protein